MHPKSLITKAELMARSPEHVYAWLKSRASELIFLSVGWDNENSISRCDADDGIEFHLAARNNALIDLALAQFGSSWNVAQSLYARWDSDPSDQNWALRLACLINFGLPCVSSDNRAGWLNTCADQEMAALFFNPNINDIFLADFLQGKEPWGQVTVDRRLLAVESLWENPRMGKKSNERTRDGWAWYQFRRVANEAWNLALQAPTTEQWASALGDLYDVTLLDASPFDIDEAISRWQEPADGKGSRDEDQASGDLTPFGRVRHGLGRLAISERKLFKDSALHHADLAIRCAAYRECDLTPEEIAEGVRHDGEAFFREVLHNDHLWKTSERRSALKSAAEAASDPNSSIDAPYLFRTSEDAFKKQHPEWFAKDDDWDTPDKPGSVVLIEIQRLKSQIEELSQKTTDSFLFIKNVRSLAFFALGASLACLGLLIL